MLRVEDIEGEDAVVVISDDANAENAALDDAVNAMAPHLYDDFSGTGLDAENMLRWRVERSEYSSLLEVLEGLEDGPDPGEVEEAINFMEIKSKEVIGE
jgi:hypothetical protein